MSGKIKQRFSSLDVKVIAHELSTALVSLRVANCYDLSSRIFLFKFHKPGQREQLIIDSGFRCHLTSFARTTASEPSAFVSRLRKFLKSRRVTCVEQIGTDRVIEFTFSDGIYRLFLEFYAGGNVVLCDKDLKVIALLRRVSAGAGEEEIREGMIYSLDSRQNFHGAPRLSIELLRTSLQKQVDKENTEIPNKKTKRKQGDGLRRAVALAVPEFPPVLVEHCFKVRQFDGSSSPEDILKDDDRLQRLLDVLEEAKQQSDDIVASSPSKGYIIAKPAKQRPSLQAQSGEGQDTDKENVALVYEDFHPFRPKQFVDQADTTVIEIVGFNKAVDDFFSSLESQRLESRLTERELNAQRRIESARQDHEKRIGGLRQVQELNVRKAQAIEANLQRVEEATAAVNGLIAQGMDWEDIGSLIKAEQARHNPVAAIIKLPLKLEENAVTLILGEEEQGEDEADFDDASESEASDEQGAEETATASASAAITDNKLLEVDIDLALTGWANAGQYYDQKRTAAVKEVKTVHASEDALKRHEKNVQADLKKGLAQEKQALRIVRQQHWFEKFYHFITPEGFLVIGANDKAQSDMLYKRHLGRGDIWIHADLEGASHLIVKNRPGKQGEEIPPTTLAQAGNFCVCSSGAWESKAIMGAWWVNADQVSKLAPNGDFLGPGLFEIKGEKQHLPPSQLLLGFGIMFRLSAASSEKRKAGRLPLGEVSTETVPSEPHEKDIGTEDPDGIKSGADAADSDYGESEPDEQENRGNTYQNPLQYPNHDNAIENNDNGADATSEEGDQEETEGDERGPLENKHDDPKDQQASVSENSTKIAEDAVASHVRGKKGKAAKIKSKYAWQDEEDRALALRLLGSSKGQDKKEADAEQKASKQAAEAAAKERRREQHRAAQQKGKEAEEARQKRLAGEPADEEEELEDLSTIDNYVGMPKAGDEIEDCIVVCAPWETMGPRFRWRTKIQPGTTKKGRAVKEILSSWSVDIIAREKKRMPPQDDERWPEEKMLRREGELIKAVRDVEVVGCLPVKTCRVVTSGGDVSKGKGKGGGGNKGAKGGGAKGARGGKGGKKK